MLKIFQQESQPTKEQYGIELAVDASIATKGFSGDFCEQIDREWGTKND